MEDFQIFIPFEKSTSADGELRLFGGIASSSSVDRDLERIDKAVLPKIASDLRKNSTVFFNHDTKGLGVGTLTSAEVRGDEIHINVVPTKADGMKDVVTQINEGILKSFSIGGKIKDWENQFDEKLGKNVRLIKDVDCYEVSVVGIASNTDASILSYIKKSFEGDKVEEKKEPEKVEKTVSEQSTASTNVEKCNSKMYKCAKCGAMNTVEGADTTMGPAEKAAVLLETPEFKKVFEDFSKKYDEKSALLEKSYKERLDEEILARKAAEARIDELHKSIDVKSKALETEEQAMAKAKEPEAKKEAPKFGVFPEGKAY